MTLCMTVLRSNLSVLRKLIALTQERQTEASILPSEAVGLLNWAIPVSGDIFLRHFIGIVSISKENSRKR